MFIKLSRVGCTKRVARIGEIRSTYKTRSEETEEIGGGGGENSGVDEGMFLNLFLNKV
jgi:hypothetical protein